MMVYYIILGILGIGSLIDILTLNERVKKVLYILSILILVVFFGTRGYLGYDWYSYKPNFEKIDNILQLFSGNYKTIFSSGYELGFQLYSSVIKAFSSNYLVFNFVNTVTDFLLIYFIFKRYSKYPIFALFLYFGIYGLALEIDMMRNIKSILLFLCSIEYIEDRKPLVFVALNILGMMFHSSSLIYFPMYFILNIKWNRKFILGLFALGNIYYISDVRLIINGIRIFGSYLPGGIGQKITGYLSIIPADFPLGFSFFYAERIVIFLLIFFAGNYLVSKRYGNIFLNSTYLYVFMFLYTSELSVISLRFGILFVYSYWFAIPMLIEKTTAPAVKIGIVAVAALICCFRINNQLSFIGNKDIYTYENIFLKHRSAAEKWQLVEDAAKYKDEGHGKEISLLF
ncbi:EpsG family protein [Fusobacterium sp.]|uniref:EpsG family protein n=1 Tax=Fusobacterium sp. TaxID=68766 RepID=UPI0029021331|nr:EpsG family protein [Fusobacterium sp.]MDU1911491.1 EpsG family protein [Fusobacterium sp.]